MENVAHVLGVYGLARGVRMVVLDGVIRQGRTRGELRDRVVDRRDCDDWKRHVSGGERVCDCGFN